MASPPLKFGGKIVKYYINLSVFFIFIKLFYCFPQYHHSTHSDSLESKSGGGGKVKKVKERDFSIKKKLLKIMKALNS